MNKPPNKPPAFQLYVKDWLSSERITLMSLEAEAFLIRLLCLCWDNGSLPADPDKLEALLPRKCHGEPFKRVWPDLAEHFVEHEGRLYHAKLEKQRSYYLRKISAGKTGAEARWQTDATASDSMRSHAITKGDTHPFSGPLADAPEPTEVMRSHPFANGLPLPLPLPSKTEPKTKTESTSLVPLLPSTAEVEAASAAREEKARALTFAARVVFSYWKARMSRNGNTLFDDKRRKRLIARLRENGGNVAELLHCVDGARRDDYLMGNDPDARRKFDDIETLFRDRAQVERLVMLAKPVDVNTHPFLERDDEPPAEPT